MPSSHFDQLGKICRVLWATQPESVLDVGIGFGKYGLLAREYLEVVPARGQYGKWMKVIDGIEVFGPYVTPLQKMIYSEIHVGDALEVVPNLARTYDLVLLIDVLEHLDRDGGLKLLEAARRRGRNVLVSTPKGHWPQGPVYGNPFESHKSRWRRRDFLGMGEPAFVRDDVSLICFIGPDAPKVRRAFRRGPIVLRKLLMPARRLYRFFRPRKDPSPAPSPNRSRT